MKCPKCQYLGFETGQRCRNCGYDFSLLAYADRPPEDLPLRPAEGAVDVGRAARVGPVDLPLRTTPLRPAVAPRNDDAREAERRPGRAGGVSRDRQRDAAGAPTPDAWRDLPLFPGSTSDEPLVSVPPVPRPPLAVRKTPELPRAARPPRVVRRHEGPRLDRLLSEMPDTGRSDDSMEEPRPIALVEDADAAPAAAEKTPAAPPRALVGSGARARLLAAVVDLTTLLALDLVIVYFTIRIAGLTMAQWTALPPVSLGLFLLSVKLAYFSVFTAIGGQTIGKMAFQIRVVSEADGSIHPARAVARTIAAAVLVLPCGAGLLPALVRNGRGLHDRVASTRVIAMRPGA